jgi:hypothetical protein
VASLRDVAAYLSDLKLRTGRTNTQFDSLIYEWLNDLFEKVQTDPQKIWFLDKRVRFSINQSSSGIIALPDDFEDEYNLHIVDTATDTFTEVKDISDYEAKKKYGPETSGEPERYSIDGKAMVIWPNTPDASYTLELFYKAKLEQVDETTDTNEFMLNYHELIMSGLQAQAWEYLGQEDKGAYYWTKWEAAWANLRANNVERTLGGEIMLEPRTDSEAQADVSREEQNYWGDM